LPQIFFEKDNASFYIIFFRFYQLRKSFASVKKKFKAPIMKWFRLQTNKPGCKGDSYICQYCFAKQQISKFL